MCIRDRYVHLLTRGAGDARRAGMRAARDADIRALAAGGMPARRIALIHRLHYSSVRRILRAAGK